MTNDDVLILHFDIVKKINFSSEILTKCLFLVFETKSYLFRLSQELKLV